MSEESRSQQCLRWNRSKGTYVRVPYKKKGTKRDTQVYHSKAQRAYKAYLDQRYGGTMVLLFTEHMHMDSNRPGFMRRFLAAQSGEVIPKVAHTPKYLAYQAECKPRSRRLAYTIPNNWITWDEEQRLETEEAERKTNRTREALSRAPSPGVCIPKYFQLTPTEKK